MRIQIVIKNSYGVERAHPVQNQDQLQRITGQATLTLAKIRAFQELGFYFNIIDGTTTELAREIEKGNPK